MSQALARAAVSEKDMDRAGREMARLIWDDDEEQPRVADPRHPVFARGVIDEFSSALREAPGVIRKVMHGASSAAEDLNVEPFQGLIEVIQNADDVGAEEVRFALRETNGTKQLLIVHDGDPVTYEHVLAMTLPFLTTKEEDAGQRRSKRPPRRMRKSTSLGLPNSNAIPQI